MPGPDAWGQAVARVYMPPGDQPKTLKDYRDIINRYVKPHIGGQKLQAVRPATIARL
ncbi:hypothetical protein Mame01_53700 [Microbispora amethystogenes]|nr:hypothetical protein Mame01_53700 [Microbispora amethystogenes]